MRLNSDLREFVGLLNSAGVEYLIVGGHAVSFHGYPRFTGDIDFWVRPSSENARKVLMILDAFGFGGLGISIEDVTTAGRVIQLGRPPNRIDLLTAISGVEFERAWQTRVCGMLDGIPVPFIGREALIANKRASGRAKDLADLEELEH